MNKKEKPLILSIDDDRDFLGLIEQFLSKSAYRVITAESGEKGLEIAHKIKPNLILLDIKMKGMDGYEICSRLQQNSETSYIPVIFLTVLGEEHQKARAFSVGGVDYLVKPVQKDSLLKKIKKHIKTDARWKTLHKDNVAWYERIHSGDFIKFKELLSVRLNLTPEKKYKLSKISPSNIYSIASDIGITSSKMAQYIAEFLDLPYISSISPEDVQLGVLPAPFCRSNHVVAVNDVSTKKAFVLTNPFNWDCLENLKKFAGLDKTSKITISEPESIDLLLRYEATIMEEEVLKSIVTEKKETHIVEKTTEIPESEIKKNPIIYIANIILDKAISENTSDIHILPKEAQTVVRFRIDGDLKDFYNLKKDTSVKLISRYKVLGDIDIAEKRKPQDGGFAATIDNRAFNLRISTTLTPYGESMIIRLLEPYSNPKDLKELGMTGRQVDNMIGLATHSEGLILVVGPTGSGKTTTIYSLLHKMDFKTHSLISIEDPIEYRIPFANQQQVNEKLGVTFETLLRSAVRQDPDILFMGEIRDQYTSKMSLDFASTGHLTISSLHTSNATTAVLRLERLGVDRKAIADTLLAVIAQRLLKKLCRHCRKIVAISQKEKDMLSPFTNDIPLQVAHPVGCPKCNETGYLGREGVYEVLEFDPKISEMIRSGLSITEIRSFVQGRGGFLKSNHAVEKVRKFIFSPKDVYEKVIIEDIKLEKSRPGKLVVEAQPYVKAKGEHASILIADDDEDTRKLIGHILKKRGYRVEFSKDGIDVLIRLAQKTFDLIISDVNMPNLDGFRLLEMMNQKGIKAPVIFLTARDALEDERTGLKLGAMDYIKKPIQKEILTLRVKSALERIK